ncbi:hypothetical protein [Spirochaeta cellobiosiphila]|uniref:hypothetical protein n=1 Tax=Spirochaeta cellobiosiphila TaxID=504483 RepID=UPI0004070BFD|nr:hypothetical protein [Spirochaeta cellobiosiphila]
MAIRLPTVIVPYAGPCNENCRDLFVYLRPESNGVEVESVLMRVFMNNPAYKGHVKIVYMANLPGSFINDRKIIENHYAVKYHFASLGKKTFTPYMAQAFTQFFSVPFEDAHIVGAFEALRILGITPEELVKLWVDPFDMMTLNGQTIKHKDDLYIVNYDIPALLHKNSNRTDLAAMIFRTDLDWEGIHAMFGHMTEALIEEQILDPRIPPSRVFHFSKSPFEMLLDGCGYLVDKEYNAIPVMELTFAHWLLDRGIPEAEILGIIGNPIFRFPGYAGGVVEENLLTYTTNHTYEEALARWRSATSQVLIMS